MAKNRQRKNEILKSVKEQSSPELRQQSSGASSKPLDMLLWSYSVTRVLFKCWLVSASVAAFRLLIAFALISCALAFFVGLLRLDSSLAELINGVFYLVGRFTMILMLAEGVYLLCVRGTFKPSSSNFGLNFPHSLRELRSIDKLCPPEEMIKQHRAKLLKHLMESFKSEFTYWSDRLKLFGAVASSVSAFFGVRFIESNPQLAVWAITIGIFSSWIFLVGLRLGKVTQRGLRHFSRQLLLAESDSTTKTP